MKNQLLNFVAGAVCCLCLAFAVTAQTTSFVYQGNLVFSGQPANGNFDFEFALFDAATAGSQLGSTQTANNVAVAAGVFTVNLDFGGQFPGANRFLEIRVRQAGQPGLTTLSPRQPISSTPYAVRSLAAETAQTAASATNAANATTAATATNSLNLGGVAANQFVVTGDARLSDARSPLPGSPNYVQNTTSVQASADFNISGTGQANVLRAETQFNIGNERILSSPSFNSIFAGANAGAANTIGDNNSFFGTRAGEANTSGGNNSFFGRGAGQSNESGMGNSFLGRGAGVATQSGGANAFVGTFAGSNNVGGSSNSALGAEANMGSADLSFATAIGAGAVVSASNTVALGRPADTVQISGNLNVTGTINGNGGTLTTLNASNITTGTLANERLGQIPTVNIADGAVTDAKIASVSGAKVTGAVANATNATNATNAVNATTAANATNATNATNAVTATNALNLGGVAANQYVQTGDPRLSDARAPLPGSGNYIQNSATQQASSNFNISGNGTAAGTLSGNVINATTRYELGGIGVFSINGSFNDFEFVTPASNTIVGAEAGLNLTPSPDIENSTGKLNSFFGSKAGQVATEGRSNSFFGARTGASTTSGSFNSFFGQGAGFANATGSFNSHFGFSAGGSNTNGVGNVFVGSNAGQSITGSSNNTFVGTFAGSSLVSGQGNTLVGRNAGINGTSATSVTLLGQNALGASGISNSTAIGAFATVTQSNSLVLGSIDGVNQATNDTNVGIGTTAPRNRLEVNGGILVTGPRATFTGNGVTISSESTFDLVQSFGNRPLVLNGLGNRVGINVTNPTEQLEIGTNSSSILFGGAGCPSGSVGIGLNGAFASCTNYTVRGDGTNVFINRPTGGNIIFREGNGSNQLSINAGGVLQLNFLGTSGGTALCRNAFNVVAFCSSSLRYKKNISPFAPGMSFISQLRPIAYEWTADGMKDVGFGAEDVAKIDPRFVTYNDKGEVEGIKYDRMSAAFVNAFREQESEIESLKQELAEQKAELDALKRFICSQTPAAEFCRSNKENK